MRGIPTLIMFTREPTNRDSRVQWLFSVLCFGLLAWLVMPPITAEAFANLGGYIADKTMSSGVNATLLLGGSVSGPIILGSDINPAVTVIGTSAGADLLRNTLTLVMASGILLVSLRFSSGNRDTLITMLLIGLVGIVLVRSFLF